jgi:hypothetical protein
MKVFLTLALFMFAFFFAAEARRGLNCYICMNRCNKSEARCQALCGKICEYALADRIEVTEPPVPPLQLITPRKGMPGYGGF